MSVSYEEALSHIRNVAATLNSQLLINPVNLPLPQSLGSISTQDVTSNRTLPPLDNSAMDGFAVTSSETLHASHQNPIRLKILGSIAAGDHPISYDENTTPALSCFYINTGAPFPLPSQWQQQDDAFHYEPRFDACLRKEDASISQDGKYVELHKPVNKRQHRRKAGEDFLPGMKIISKYDKITPERIAALSYHGISCIDTIPQPKIAILSTGKELEQLDAFPPNKPPPSHIYDSNSYYLLAALYQWGFTNVERLESLGDDPADFKKTVEECAKRDFELLITTGGVSKGQHDYIECVYQRLLVISICLTFYANLNPLSIESNSEKSRSSNTLSRHSNAPRASSTTSNLFSNYTKH